MKVLVGLLLLLSSVFLVVPAMLGVKTLMVASSLLSAPSLFASFVILVSSASIAIFLQLGILALTAGRTPQMDAPVPAGPAPAPTGLGKRSLRLAPFVLAALALLPGCAQAPAAQAATPAACGSAAPGQVVANAVLRDGKASRRRRIG